MEKITKSAKEIYDDAPGVVVDFYEKISQQLMRTKGEDFPEDHPEVVARLADAAVKYYTEEREAKALLEVAEMLEEKIDFFARMQG